MFYLKQSHYIKEVGKKFNVNKEYKTKRPCANTEFIQDSEDQCDKPLRNLIGALSYIAEWSRPDISTSVSVLSQRMHDVTEARWKAGIQILKYLVSTADYCLKIDGSLSNDLEVYTDADFAGDISDRKSQSGYMIFLYGNLIAWKSKKQSVVAHSSTDAEYIALHYAIENCTSIYNLLLSINEKVELPIVVYEDNTSCIHSVFNGTSLKHLEVKFHSIRESVNSGLFKLVYVPSNEQKADSLTKVLPKKTFSVIRKEMNLVIRYVKDERGC